MAGEVAQDPKAATDDYVHAFGSRALRDDDAALSDVHGLALVRKRMPLVVRHRLKDGTALARQRVVHSRAVHVIFAYAVNVVQVPLNASCALVGVMHKQCRFPLHTLRARHQACGVAV